MTAIITIRAAKNSAAHLFLETCALNFENNCDRIVRRLHRGYGMTHVPAPTVADEVAKMAREDDVLAQQLCGGVIHQSFEDEIANTIAAEFNGLRGDITPSRKAIGKVVGSKLALAAEDLLSLAEKLAIVRTMSKQSAIALCEIKIRSHRARLEDSICSPGVMY